eukprot:TRINITY_DN5889_c0_g1_i2.p1 TRINITY_DN5889_c0_g1~~TRINITY_DN5889_c0_g1_i2.p1  ORF type:complete len:479 (+),score=145.55 TRINITY_DN5889_c0_g1_i2:76-1512(+)
MGAQMCPQAVEVAVIERNGNRNFEVATAEMNGFRGSMEDSHLVYFCDDWGFFGVFDGHGGSQSAAFVSKRLAEVLREKGCPKDDAAVKEIMFKVDQEIKDERIEDGTTATMCIVTKPSAAGGKCQLRVINAGDSRTLLGRRDGTIVDGGGTDKGLTTDHKPDMPTERDRIIKAGGKVEIANQGVARVDGDLAVSRGFGDHKFKTCDRGPEHHKVTVDPDLGRFECEEADFLLLVCDGVSEGEFSNSEVVELVAQSLREDKDTGVAATKVCRKAIERGSKDNISCMIVLLNGAKSEERTIEVVAGSVEKFTDKTYFNAYKTMCERGGKPMAEIVEQRYEWLQQEAARNGGAMPRDLEIEAESLGLTDGDKNLLPTKAPEKKGSDERKKWFESWIEEAESRQVSAADPSEAGLLGVMRLLQHGGALGGSSGYNSLDRDDGDIGSVLQMQNGNIVIRRPGGGDDDDSGSQGSNKGGGNASS